MKNHIKIIALLSFLFVNVANRDINIELFKKESVKNKGIEEVKINNKLVSNLDLENGYLSEFNEDFFYLTTDVNNKPYINNEKVGIQYGIKKISEEDYVIDINIKTDKTLETLSEEIFINKYQKTQKISDFKIKSKKIEAKIIREKEKIVIEIGQEYYMTLEKSNTKKSEEIKK